MVASGASLYEENKNGETACDCAIKGNFNDIASFLESRMVFSVSIDHVSKLKKSSTDVTCTCIRWNWEGIIEYLQKNEKAALTHDSNSKSI